MGAGASSRFGETDWDAVDGGLNDSKLLQDDQDKEESAPPSSSNDNNNNQTATPKNTKNTNTLDGSEPTQHHSILTLRKPNIVNQRTFDIRNDLGELLYTSKPIEGTTKWFELLDQDGRPLFLVQTNALRSKWQIYSYDTPNWENQESAGASSNNADNVAVTTTISKSEPSRGSLYPKATIVIAWHKHHGKVHLMKPAVDENNSGTNTSCSSSSSVMAETPVLQVEEIKSITAQYQSFVPSKLGPVVDSAIHPPLVGWWVWEHTPNRHQMKLHLSKGTDVALHCLVAIVTNMVHVENKTLQDKVQ